MPDLRWATVAPRRPGGGLRSPRGVGILRGYSPVGSGGGRVRRGSPGIEQENVPPQGSGSCRRRRRKMGSPLPAWYPRTPLRDVTVIVNVLERRRNRLMRGGVGQTRNEEVGRSLRNNTPPDDSFRPRQHSPAVVSKASNLESVPSSPSPTSCRPPSCGDAESERRLSRCIDEIERRVRERTRNTDKGTSNACRRSTLMCMR